MFERMPPAVVGARRDVIGAAPPRTLRENQGPGVAAPITSQRGGARAERTSRAGQLAARSAPQVGHEARLARRLEVGCQQRRTESPPN